MTRYFLDQEFDEDGRTIQLISIGLVCDDGREYYAVSKEFDPLHCNDWVKQNVLSKLPPPGHPDWKSRAQIRAELEAFIGAGGGLVPEFWGYFADYDWVVFCQLWGRMLDLPAYFPKYCLDLKQSMHRFDIAWRDLPDQPEGSEHHALADARWNKQVFDWISLNYGKGYKI